MKSVAKLISAIAILSLFLTMFNACNFDFGNNPEEETTALTETTAEITQAVAPTSTTADDITTTAKLEAESIETVLNKILNFPMGTAGSTQKCVEIALVLINFTENNEDTDVIRNSFDIFEKALSEDEEDTFEENLAEVDYYARRLIKGDDATLAEYIEESSSKYDKGNYSLEKYETIYNIFED